MFRIGLVLILAFALTGGLFHVLGNQPKHAAASAPAIPVTPVQELKEEKVSSNRDVDFGPYMANLQRRIKRAWFPPKCASDRIQVTFRVHSDGHMTGVRVTQASSSQAANEAALKAVQNASPFRPLPTGAPENVDIQFTFDYNLFKGSPASETSTFRRF